MYRRAVMRPFLLPAMALCLLLSGCIKDRNFPYPPYREPQVPDPGSRQPVHYWNFNAANLLTPTSTIGGGALDYSGGGSYDAVSPGSVINAVGSDAAGSGLRLRNPGGVFTLTLPSTNYKDLLLSFAAQRSNNGAQHNIISYTIDGINFITDSLRPNIHQLDTSWQSFFYDFSEIRRTANNPNFKIRFNFAVNDTGSSGNDRYDNICLWGNIINVNPPAPEIVHYWNFNTISPVTALLLPAFTAGGGALDYAGAYFDDFSPGSPVNARNGDPSGSAIRLRSGYGDFTMTLPSTGYKNLRLSFEVQRSSSGATLNQVSYSTDGSSFVNTALPLTSYAPALDPAYQLVNLDLSGIPATNNNPQLKIRISFSGSNTGNNRFDNLVLEGIRL